MKKSIFLLAAAVILAGCTFPPKKTSQPEAPSTKAEMVTQFEKVADAMASGKSVECVMTQVTSNNSFTYQVKGKKIHAFGQLSPEASESGNMLTDGEFMYTWSDQTKEGTKFLIPTETEVEQQPEDLSKVVPDFRNTDTQQEYENLGYSINCTEKNLDDSVFIAPSDVKFTDLSQMMGAAKQYQQQMKDASTSGGSELTQEQLQQMMKSFGDQQ